MRFLSAEGGSGAARRRSGTSWLVESIRRRARAAASLRCGTALQPTAVRKRASDWLQSARLKSCPDGGSVVPCSEDSVDAEFAGGAVWQES